MRDLHHILFAVLVGVAALHVAGALKHHFIDRNDVLRRMLPFGGPRETK
jgi:cytochrome b561